MKRTLRPASGSTGVVEQNNTAGSSYFDSLNVRLERRLTHGLSLIGNYMYSKLMEEDSYLNYTDPAPENRVSPFDHTHHFVMAASYQLPIGKGQAIPLNSRLANALLGIYTYQTGAPLLWINGSTTNIGDYVYFGGPIHVYPRQVNGPAFDTSVFDTKSADALQYHMRTYSTTFGNLRADGINNFDASILKRFNIRETRYFELRMEAFNVLNHPTFSAPNTTVANSSFGLITAQANLPRQIQLGARFVF